MFVGNTFSHRNPLINWKCENTRQYFSQKSFIDCNLDLASLSWVHSKHSPIFGIRLQVTICLMDHCQPISFHLLTTSIQQSTNDWSAKITTHENILCHYMQYGSIWQDIEAPKLHRSDRSKDMFYVDRYFAFNASNTLYYLSHMNTKKNVSWNLLNEYEFPFDFNVISYINENGIDEGALTQDFFDNLYTSLSSIITGTDSDNQNGVVLYNEMMSDHIIQRGVLSLIRVCSLCWRMKVKWRLKSEKESREAADFENDGIAMQTQPNIVDIDCRFDAGILNPRYFQIAMGKMDVLIQNANGQSKKFIKYISRLADDNLVESWLPNFVKRYFENGLEMDEIEIMIERVDGAHSHRLMPESIQSKMELIKDYLFVVSFKGIIQIIETNLYFFGIIPHHQWLSYSQFYDLMYVEQYFAQKDVDKFLKMIGNDDNWRSDVDIDYETQQRLQMCLDGCVQQHFMMEDTKWIQNLLRFWTAKKWIMPKKIEIYIQSAAVGMGEDREHNLEYLPKASACYNKLYLNEYMVENVQGEFFDPMTDCVRFGELLDLAISSTDGHGFGSF